MLGLRTVVYKVADIKKAKEWYSNAFDKQAYFDEPFYVGFNIDGFELGLQPDNENINAKSEGVIAYWGVDNINEVFDKLLAIGAAIHEKPQNVGGNIMVASVKDPWENVIGIIYNPDFKFEQ